MREFIRITIIEYVAKINRAAIVVAIWIRSKGRYCHHRIRSTLVRNERARIDCLLLRFKIK